MSSRRLDINSLLCDEPSKPKPQEDPIILAPHLVSDSSRDHGPVYHNSYPQHVRSHSSPMSGLDALVHAASQERRRLSSASEDYPNAFPLRTATFPPTSQQLYPPEQPSRQRVMSYPDIARKSPFELHLESPIPRHIREFDPRPHKRRRQSDDDRMIVSPHHPHASPRPLDSWVPQPMAPLQSHAYESQPPHAVIELSPHDEPMHRMTESASPPQRRMQSPQHRMMDIESRQREMESSLHRLSESPRHRLRESESPHHRPKQIESPHHRPMQILSPLMESSQQRPKEMEISPHHRLREIESSRHPPRQILSPQLESPHRLREMELSPQHRPREIESPRHHPKQIMTTQLDIDVPHRQREMELSPRHRPKQIMSPPHRPREEEMSPHRRQEPSLVRLMGSESAQHHPRDLEPTQHRPREVSLSLDTPQQPPPKPAAPKSKHKPKHVSHDVEHPKPPRKPATREQDAHEWLLQHYATVRVTPPTLEASPSPEPAPPPPPASEPVVPPISTPAPNSPESALAALEHELDSVPTPVPTETIDVTKVDEEPDVDVDTELLMLVDDKPSPPPSPRKQSSSTSKPSDPVLKLRISPPPRPSPMRSAGTTPVLERGSMPPPPTDGSAPVSASSKKKKAPSKPRPKPAAKPRAKTGSKSSTLPAKTKTQQQQRQPSPSPSPKKSAPPGAMARSRSVSVVPGAEAEIDEEEKQEEDDKLYCICKTRYDEDRVMIACDRCDEWYHTQCVQMPDLEIDLVDQFICPPCVESNPGSSLRTTYKPRCLAGLRHEDPASAIACHKPARGALSKYCSDECGMRTMQQRIEAWTKQGGEKEKLWESVKDAEPREGVTIYADMAVDVKGEGEKKKDRDAKHLKKLLGAVVSEREMLKKQMEVVQLRERLTELASRRSEGLDTCGWDQRLCFSEEEYAEFGAGVLESYEEEQEEDEEAMQVDGARGGEWWCMGKKKCDRHPGWQKLRAAEVAFEREVKETALSKLTQREREIRKRIEDLVEPYARPKETSPNGKGALALGPSKHANGHKIKLNGEQKKGKKRT